MDALREAIQEQPAFYLALGGLTIGFVFGYLIYRTNFCTMGSISDIMNLGDYNRFRAWILAAVTALIGAQLLHYLEIIDLTKSMYLSQNFNWLGNILGGLMFGYGMVFAGGCASKNLARMGGGDLRSALTLTVMGIVGYMSIGGIIGPVRNYLAQNTSISLEDMVGAQSQGLGELVASAAALPTASTNLVVMAIVALLALIYIFSSKDYRAQPIHIVSGIGIGLCVVAGWFLTGLAFDELADKLIIPVSLTYVRPTGDTLEWLQRFTAETIPGFGVSTVLGAILGSFSAAMIAGRFKITTFADVADTKRNLYGATLMGIGGVVALGCTVGQAITGVSTLAIGSFLTFLAIVIGGIIGMKRFEKAIMADI